MGVGWNLENANTGKLESPVGCCQTGEDTVPYVPCCRKCWVLEVPCKEGHGDYYHAGAHFSEVRLSDFPLG